MSKELFNAILEMREKESLMLANKLLEQGADPLKLIESCREAMNVVGRRFEKNEYFLPELILGGRILSQITEMAKPRLVKIYRLIV